MQAEFQKITLKSCFYKLIFKQTRKKIELASITCLTKPEDDLLALLLPAFVIETSNLKKDLRLDVTK